MQIKKIKKVTSLKKNDIILVSIESQQDSGVYCDITDPNVLAIVFAVKETNGGVVVLTNGGYEYEFHDEQQVFYIDDYTELSDDADLIIDMFDDGTASKKEINKFIKTYNK